MFCTMCGKEIENESIFCKYCGSKVKVYNAEEHSEAIQTSVEKEFDQENELNSEKELADENVFNNEKELANENVFNNEKELANENVLNSERELTNEKQLTNEKELNNNIELTDGKELNNEIELMIENELLHEEQLAKEKEIIHENELLIEGELNSEMEPNNEAGQLEADEQKKETENLQKDQENEVVEIKEEEQSLEEELEREIELFQNADKQSETKTLEQSNYQEVEFYIETPEHLSGEEYNNSVPSDGDGESNRYHSADEKSDTSISLNVENDKFSSDEDDNISIPYDEVLNENTSFTDNLASDVKNIVNSEDEDQRNRFVKQGVNMQHSESNNSSMQNTMPFQTNVTANPSDALNQANNKQIPPAAETDAKKGKKKRKAIIIAAAVTGVLLIGGSIGGYFIYQNFLDKQAEKVIALFDDKDYEESVSLYEKYCDDKKDLKADIETALKERAEEVKEDYFSESLGYEDALNFLAQIEEYDNDTLTDTVEDTKYWIDKIESSREAYRLGESLYSAGNYESAIIQYQKVLEEDTAYASLAADGIKASEEAIQEQEKKQEEERLNSIKTSALSDSEKYMNDYDYESAINLLKEALISWPEDAELTTRLKECEERKAEGEAVSNISMVTSEQTFKEGEINLLTYSFEYPVLTGKSPAYDSINKIFETLNEENLSSCETWADSLRETSGEEYFFQNEYQNTANVSYNKNGILDICINGYAYYGGAHGEPIRTNYVFDLKTGQILTMRDLIKDVDSFNQKVVDAFEVLISAEPGNYWENAMETVTSTQTFENNYYLAEDGVHVYFYPYELAAYAAGMVEVTIPYSGNEGLFGFLEN